MNLRRLLYIGSAILIILLVFTVDVVRKTVDLDIGGIGLLRNILILGAIVLLYRFLDVIGPRRDPPPIKRLGFIMIATVLVTIVTAVLTTTSADAGFDTKNNALLPLDYGVLFIASLVSVLLAVFSVLMIRVLRGLILFKRRKGTERNLYIFGGLMVATSASTLWLDAVESGIISSILFGLAAVFIFVNSFRLSWIVYLTKREKIFSLIYSLFLFIGLILLNVLVHQSFDKSLRYYSYPLQQMIWLVCLFGVVYFGMAFISTLFHLPTAEAFDRKTTEVSSLHNLSRLVTQVFDFNELVETVTSMTLQVCEAHSCWLEIIRTPEDLRGEGIPVPVDALIPTDGGLYHIQVGGMKNISQQDVDLLLSPHERSVRDMVMAQRTAIIVDDISRDARFAHLKHAHLPVGSLVVVPLVSHQGLIGILYATKQMAFGFFQDDVEMISAFADQATIAIENSRLIKKSIERERLMREMVLAQEMQKKLLPQDLPRLATVQLDAVSTPAQEVGGDYYDFAELADGRLGIVVGDVSGKGVSAAFYMSEVKGIFQSLSSLYGSPKEFMIHANDALAKSIDNHSFVSLIYAVLDPRSGSLTLARAGHCPMLHIHADAARYIRPTGMGLGMSDGEVFAGTMEEESVVLRPGDVCLFYTDGVTEARQGDEEFGYERLRDAAGAARHGSAHDIKTSILDAVRAFSTQHASHDDLTLVVLKWQGPDVPLRNGLS